MSTIALALAAGALFGLLIAGARWALSRGPDPEAGAAVTAIIGAVLTAAIAAAAGHIESTSWSSAWPYLAIGAIVPGAAQVFFIHAVRAVGASRTGIVIGMAPLLSAVIAVIALDERPHAALGVGTALIVLGGGALAWEPDRPVEFRAVGLFLALACATLFATRDNLFRALAEEDPPPVLFATALSLAAAAAFTLVYLGLRRGRASLALLGAATAPFALPGVVLGLAYVTLVAALDRGAVTLVAPLNATQSLWAIAFAAVIIGVRADAIGRRLVGAGVLVAVGSALVAAFR